MVPKIGVINIEPTNYCNLKCIYCIRNPIKRPDVFMSLDLYEEILRQIESCTFCDKGVQLKYFLSGEPFYHPHLCEMISMAAERGYRATEIHTNATLLTGDIIKQIIGAGLDAISVSFDGLTEEEYESRRVGARFEEILANTRRLVAMSKGANLKVTIKIIIPLNVSMARVRRELERFIPHIFHYYLRYSMARVNRKLEKLIPYAFHYQVRNPHNWCEGPNTIRGSLNSLGKCKVCFPNDFFPIYADGRVPLCCADLNGDWILGSIQKDGIEKLWATKFQDIRERMSKRLPIPELCDKCERYI